MPIIKKVGSNKFVKEITNDEIATPNIQYLDTKIEIDRTKESALTMLLHPSSEGWKDIYKAGWKPAFFNQQWGGSQWGQLPDGSFGDVAAGFIHTNTTTTSDWAIGKSIVSFADGQEFKVSFTGNYSEIWFKLGKIGNPTDNLTVSIYDDNAGLPNAIVTNGVSNTVSAKTITSDTFGNWVKFTFSTNPTLTANATYYAILNRTGGVDASNYCVVIGGNSSVPTLYPHGTRVTSDNTPTWTVIGDNALAFLLVAESSNQFLQKDTTNGISSAKLVCNEGTPLNQSKALTNKLRNFLNQEEFSYQITGKSFTKDKTIVDFTYGLDHDRVVLRSNITTGFPQVDLYESDGTKHTITGTTDVSTTTIKSIEIKCRAKNDGSDYLYLYINGTSEGTPLTSQSFSFDKNFSKLGTVWIGGGFPLAPTWTQDLDMSVLPSASGWTWNGGAVEADAMVISGSKLYQNKSGYGANTGYYSKTVAGLINSSGYTSIFKIQAKEVDDSATVNLLHVKLSDDIVATYTNIFQNYMNIYRNNAMTSIHPQMDFSGKENVICISQKGGDQYIFINGQLIVDGSNSLTVGGGTGSISFGDIWSGGNADAVWDYLKYYETSSLFPEISSCEIYEFGCWSGDKSNIFSSLYNSGTRKSIKDFCGIKNNYVERVDDLSYVQGIVSSPTYTSILKESIPDLKMFVLSRNRPLLIHSTVTAHNDAGAELEYTIDISGKQKFLTYVQNGANHKDNADIRYLHNEFITGLNSIEIYINKSVPSNTTTLTSTLRSLLVES